ncbi:hypothetical protein C0J52_10700 [Blattella germanica]|nr:hypothetical protein C0J52_10700 [Blattella germanica]
MGKVRGEYRKEYGRVDMTEAVEKILKDGWSTYKASKVYSIPYNTLKDQLKLNPGDGTKTDLEKLGRPFALTSKQELKVVEYIRKMKGIGFGLSASDLLFTSQVPGIHYPNVYLSVIPADVPYLSNAILFIFISLKQWAVNCHKTGFLIPLTSLSASQCTKLNGMAQRIHQRKQYKEKLLSSRTIYNLTKIFLSTGGILCWDRCSMETSVNHNSVVFNLRGGDVIVPFKDHRSVKGTLKSYSGIVIIQGSFGSMVCIDDPKTIAGNLIMTQERTCVHKIFLLISLLGNGLGCYSVMAASIRKPPGKRKSVRLLKLMRQSCCSKYSDTFNAETFSDRSTARIEYQSEVSPRNIDDFKTEIREEIVNILVAQKSTVTDPLSKTKLIDSRELLSILPENEVEVYGAKFDNVANGLVHFEDLCVMRMDEKIL